MSDENIEEITKFIITTVLSQPSLEWGWSLILALGLEIKFQYYAS